MSLRQLMLLRHAKSLWNDPEQPDHARPLNARGHAAAAGVRTALRQHGLSPDVVLVSSARRTLQTLDALEPWEETPLIEVMDRLYLATVPTLLGVLRGVAETVRSVMVIGHNPGLQELAARLEGGTRIAELPTAGLAVFTVARHWGGLLEGGAGAERLDLFVRPRDQAEGEP